jgi:hypothetical protein
MSGALRPSQSNEQLNEQIIWCVNELVSSALEECESGVTIKMSVDSDTLHVAVTDDGPPSAGVDLSKDHDDLQRLRIVNALADRWGATPTDSGHEAWVEFDLNGRREMRGA